jgi:hypothetical protein
LISYLGYISYINAHIKLSIECLSNTWFRPKIWIVIKLLCYTAASPVPLTMCHSDSAPVRGLVEQSHNYRRVRLNCVRAGEDSYSDGLDYGRPIRPFGDSTSGCCSEHARSSQIAVHLLGHNIALCVFHLDHVLGGRLLPLLVLLDLLPKSLSFLDACNLPEKRCVGDA